MEKMKLMKLTQNGSKSLVLVLMLGVVAGCQQMQPAPAISLGQAAAVITHTLPDAVVAKIVATCEKYGSGLKYATLPFLPEVVRETAIDAAAYCEQITPEPALASTPAAPIAKTVVLPPTTDSNTASWMDRVVRGLKRAGEIARVVLPGI